MAIVFTLLSMLMTCGSDLFEKKAVSSTTEEVLKTLIWYGLINLLLLIVMLLFGLDETSLYPHELLLKKPVIALSPILNYVCLFFALAAYKYVGVSVRNTFVNTDSLFYAILLVLYHLTTGNATFATRLFNPLLIIGLILVIGGGMTYPHIRSSGKEKDGDEGREAAERSKMVLITGILIAFVSAFFDGAESMVTSVLIGDDIVDSMDYIATAAFIQVIITLFIWVYLWIKNKKPHNPFRKTEKNRMISESFTLLSDILYVFALSEDAVLGIVLWSAFPILDIVGARIFMKERLNRPQYLVLFMMIIGAVFISLS